jgi:uncharacterized protein YkwD
MRPVTIAVMTISMILICGACTPYKVGRSLRGTYTGATASDPRPVNDSSGNNGGTVNNNPAIPVNYPYNPVNPVNPVNTVTDGSCYKAEKFICDIERAIIDQTNAYRSKRGLQPLACALKLGFAARTWSNSQARKGWISHSGFPNARYQDIQQEFGSSDNIDISAENVAMTGSSGTDAQAVATDFTDMWWGSSGHRANMLGDYKSIGVGIASDGSGSYYGTQDFGTE